MSEVIENTIRTVDFAGETKYPKQACNKAFYGHATCVDTQQNTG